MKLEPGKSKLYLFKPLIDKWPAVTRPEGHVGFRTKMLWTFLILVLYYALTNVMIYGLKQEEALDLFSNFRAIMAGASGSLMHLGIGPIVTGSIIMQLFTGAKIIKLDLQDAEDKAIYQGFQKILVVVMIFVEAIPQVYGQYLQPDAGFVKNMDGVWSGHGDWLAKGAIVLQLAVGSYLVFLMDEVVSKWGIGSGISMFIAAGVSQAIFTGCLNWLPIGETGYSVITGPDTPTGTIPRVIYMLFHLSASDLVGGGLEHMFLAQPNPIIALLGTAVTFFIVAYTESSRIELPLAHGKARGARGRYPIRLIYASNIPVILMSALLANINMFSMLFWSHPTLSRTPLVGHAWWVGKYVDSAGQPTTTPTAGGAWYLTSPQGVQDWLLPLIDFDTYGQYMNDHEWWQVALRLLVYLGLMIGGSILFAKFWIETTDMGPDAVARQIVQSGMHIPGFRRDPRRQKKILEKYIPAVTVISGAFVGALAAGADLVGTVGNTSGTGVLLTVGIMIQLYEQIGREQMMEMHPMLRGFFGQEA